MNQTQFVSLSRPIPTSQSGNRLRWELRAITVFLSLLIAGLLPVAQWTIDGVWPRLSLVHLVLCVAGSLVAVTACLPVRWNLKCLLAASSTFLALIAVECAISLSTFDQLSSLYSANDTWLYDLRPDSSKIFTRTAINGGNRIAVKVNHQGMRGLDTPVRTAIPRILVCGDSNIFAEFSNWEDTYCEQLKSELIRLRKSPVEVLNTGVVGFGPDQILLRLIHHLPEWKPELVILAVFADNDLGDILRNKLFRLDDRGNLVSHQGHLSPTCRIPGTRQYEPGVWRLARLAVRGTQSNLGISTSHMNRWLAACQDEYQQYILQCDPYIHDLETDHYDADVSLQPQSNSARYKRLIFEKILERIKQQCEHHHARLFVLVIPSPADLISDFDFYSIDRERYPDYQPRAYSDAIAGIAEKLKIPHLNLFTTFAENNPSRLYFRGGDNHWNDAGQALAARITSRYVSALAPDASQKPPRVASPERRSLSIAK